jgi:hypothetical protein
LALNDENRMKEQEFSIYIYKYLVKNNLRYFIEMFTTWLGLLTNNSFLVLLV